MRTSLGIFVRRSSQGPGIWYVIVAPRTSGGAAAVVALFLGWPGVQGTTLSAVVVLSVRSNVVAGFINCAACCCVS